MVISLMCCTADIYVAAIETAGGPLPESYTENQIVFF